MLRQIATLAIAAVLFGTPALARTTDELQAPRRAEVEAPRSHDNQDIQAPRDRAEDIQAPRG